MDLFKAKDFKVFAIPEFKPRMEAIRSAIRPKLQSIGNALVLDLSTAVDKPLFVHVAKHARRTVNPPDDTWAAVGCSRRGYKKDVHFKIAVSRHCVRLLFEAGPEYFDKPAWAQAWRAEGAEIVKGLKGLSWFRNEHDEDPAEAIGSVAEAMKFGEELTRRRDGQFVVGLRMAAKEFASFDAKRFHRVADSAFKAMAPLFNLCSKPL